MRFILLLHQQNLSEFGWLVLCNVIFSFVRRIFSLKKFIRRRLCYIHFKWQIFSIHSLYFGILNAKCRLKKHQSPWIVTDDNYLFLSTWKMSYHKEVTIPKRYIYLELVYYIHSFWIRCAELVFGKWNYIHSQACKYNI